MDLILMTNCSQWPHSYASYEVTHALKTEYVKRFFRDFLKK